MKQLLILFLLIGQTTFMTAQEVLKDTILLNNVSIQKKHKKKTVSYDRTGHPAYGGINKTTQKMVTLLNDLPEGKILNVTLYLNTGLPNLLKKKLDINYKDVMLGIVIYEVDKKGRPGKAISENEITFLVSGKHRGALTVDLSKLNLQSGTMFFGISILSELTDKENDIYFRYCDEKSYTMYEYGKGYNLKEYTWYSYLTYSFKLHMKVEQ